jgi:hypothetical protein
MPHRWAPMSAVVCFHSNRPLVALRISRLRPKAKPCSVWCFGMPCQIFYALDPDGPQPYNDRWDMGRLWVRMQSKQKWHMPSSISKPCCRDCSMLAPPRVAYCCRPVRQLQIACHALPMHSSSCGAIFGSLQCRPSTCVLKRPAVFGSDAIAVNGEGPAPPQRWSFWKPYRSFEIILRASKRMHGCRNGGVRR